MTTEPEGSISVLLPINDSASSLSCVRSLGKHGIRTIAVSERKDRPTFSSRYCDERIIVPSPYESLLAYKDALLSLAERPDVRTVVPSREVDSYVLARYREAFEEHVVPMWPTFEQIRTVHDRLQLAETAGKAGVPVPQTWSFEEIDDWGRELIVKPRYSILTGDYLDSFAQDEFVFVKKVLQLQPNVEPDRELIRSEMAGHVPVVQEFVPIDHEYMFGALCDRGDPVATYQHKYIRRKSYSGGGSVYRKTVYNQRIDELGRRLLDHLDWHGLACVEFMKDERTGEFKLTEVNPRAWSTLPTAVRAGADFPYAHWLLATGQKARIEAEYETGIRGQFLYGQLQFVLSLLRENSQLVERPALPTTIGSVLWSILRHPSFDHLYLDDPQPFVRGVLDNIPFGGRLSNGNN
jgi:predicted ATP-grasp superfamily ATP-dependent carboligase